MEHGSPHVVESLFDAARGSVEVHGVHGEGVVVLKVRPHSSQWT